ncbi:MAG: hypothetical protein V9G19_19465 [Tetrasphaera sp.]
MAAAEPVIRAVLPDANVPTSIRATGTPVRHIARDEIEQTLTQWLDTHPDGTACVIGKPDLASTDRVQSLQPDQVKGLEFDLVILVPDTFTDDSAGVVDRYVAMTRTTNLLVVADGSVAPSTS